jgi:hydroxyacylglutathione hydrolase
MRVITVPVLGDSKNYSYLLVSDSGKAAAVDPAEPETLLEAAKKEGVTIDTVLTTHKHWDHAGGNDKIKKLVSGIEVIGGKNENVQGATRAVADGERFNYHEISVECIETPFHTMGHICYLCKASSAEDLVFTGDTLFVAGCGRFFEGTPQDAHTALGKLARLPGSTRCFVGHNYTASNLKFAQHVDPENVDIKKKAEWTKERDSQGAFTVPTTIQEEKLINPFLRTETAAMQKFTGRSDPVDVLAALRKAKDNF